MSGDLFQHFPAEEKNFVEQVLDWQGQVLDQYRPILSDFLDPREQVIAQTVLGQSHSDYRYAFWVGYDQAERQRLLIYPPYLEAEEVDYDLVLVEISYAKKFNQLSHRQVLGSLLGQGLERKVLGDILSDGERWQFITSQELLPFFIQEVDRVGRAKVALQPIPWSDRVQSQENWQERTISAASLRLDLVLAEALNLSRTKAKSLVQAKGIKQNWQVQDRVDREVAVGDTLSVRGYGRLYIDQILGQSKKGKVRLAIQYLANQ
ncbi:RNA-binding protein [Aerococcus sanguinicola]|uniref:YlmH family RNA-binding protein n=1 Tax=Aerococcus sanguinicola TaxID=119206 RepID=UPI0018A7BBA0|nr:RNA-binding protein [Aerococcus sanguinicola]